MREQKSEATTANNSSVVESNENVVSINTYETSAAEPESFNDSRIKFFKEWSKGKPCYFNAYGGVTPKGKISKTAELFFYKNGVLLGDEPEDDYNIRILDEIRFYTLPDLFRFVDDFDTHLKKQFPEFTISSFVIDDMFHVRWNSKPDVTENDVIEKMMEWVDSPAE